MKHILPYCILLFSFACKENDVSVSNTMFKPNIPSYIDKPTLLENIPENGILLGEKLFNDKNLSSSKTVSCGSCHLKEYAFGENISLSTEGVSGEKLPRHTPSLFNLAWQKTFFWDGGAIDLESQALGPLFSEHEMDSKFDSVLSYLNQSNTYKQKFNEVFTDGKINSSNFLKAISWFELSLISYSSKYDSFYSQKDSSLLTDSEQRGLAIYEAQCNNCHTLPTGSNYDFKNNELDDSFNYPIEDERLGRNRITNDTKDLGKYKTPSLRNLSFTSPYMHDGRFESIDDVLNHYSNIPKSENISVEINEEDFPDLKAFIYTLNDTSFVKN